MNSTQVNFTKLPLLEEVEVVKPVDVNGDLVHSLEHFWRPE